MVESDVRPRSGGCDVRFFNKRVPKLVLKISIIEKNISERILNLILGTQYFIFFFVLVRQTSSLNENWKWNNENNFVL